MRRRIVFALIFLLTFSFVACSRTPAPQPMEYIDLDASPIHGFHEIALPENLRDFAVAPTFLSPNIHALAAQNGRLWGIQGNLLLYSDNHGEDWTPLRRFRNPIDTIHHDDYGNLFVATTEGRWLDPGTAKLFRSSDGGDTFYKVLTILSGAPYHWSIASQNGVMFVSEYGYKGEENNARRIYRSLDYGLTWSIVWEPEPTHNWHNHKTVFVGDVIYQSIGDRPHNHVIRSTDQGETWELAIDDMHPTGALVFDTHVLWALDSGANETRENNGIAWYDRESGEITSVWQTPAPFYGASYALTIDPNGTVYAIFLSYLGDEHPASIWYSRDEGQSWSLMGYIDKPWFRGVGLWQIEADDKFGYIRLETPIEFDGAAEYFLGTLRFELIQ